MDKAGLINKHFNQLTYKVSNALLIREIKDDYEKQSEQFKQSMVQAFPSLYDQLYNNKDSDDSIENYEQVVSAEQEDFVSIMDFIQGMHTMSAQEIEE